MEIPRPNLETIHVIYLDDDQNFANLIAEYFEGQDTQITVQTVATVREALDHLERTSVDCIVSDYALPDRDGIDFLETVREDHPHLPFILFTGKGSESVASDAIRSGATDYVRKGTGTDRFTILADRIRKSVDRHASRKRLAFLESLENQITRLSRDLLQIGDQSVDEKIDDALETIGTLVDADRSYVFQIDHDEDTLTNTHEWTAAGIEPQIDDLQNLPFDTFPWWRERLENHETITITAVSELPPEADAEREILQEQNIKSLIVTPMVWEGQLIGFIGFDWVVQQDRWSEEFIDILQISGDIISNALRRESRRRELQRREAYLEQSSDIISAIDINGEVKYQSASTERVTDFTPAEIIGQSGLEHLHPDDIETFEEIFPTFASQAGSEVKEELRVRTKQGEWKWIEVRGVNKLDDPVIDGLLFSSRDISERKERERELEMFERLIDNSNDELLIVDGESATIEYVNQPAVTELQYSRNDLVGKHVSDITNRFQDIDEWYTHLQTVADKDGVQYETQLVRADGSTLPVQISDSHEEIDGDPYIVTIARDITDRKQRERRIEELKERLELAIDGANLGVWDWNLQTDDVEFNDNWATMLGYDPEQIEPHLDAWERRVHPDDKEAVEAALDEHIAGETDYYDTEHRMRTASGDWKWIRDVGKIFERDENGDPVRAVGIHLDVDERKRTERALREERDMFSQGPTVVFKWQKGDDWSVEYVSENVEEVLGYPADTIESGGVAYSELIHEDDRERVRTEVLEQSGSETVAVSHEPYRVLTREGEVRWVLDHTKNVRVGDEITHRLGYLVDITERKERERELQEFREAVEQSGHAVYITDSEGVIEYVNPAFEEITGYTEENAIGETPRILKSGEYDDEFYDEFWETLRSGGRWESEMIDEGADGEQIVLHQTISPLVDEDGEPRKYVAVAQDITERKDYEMALEAAREELRHIIDLVPDLIFSKDRDGKYILANQTTAEAYGMTPEELEGREEREVIPDVKDSEQFRADDLEVIETGEPKEIPEEELTTADGETKVLQTTKIPYQSPSSGEDVVLGYGRDVTELKEYERTLERQRNSLEILNQIVRHDVRNNLQLVLAYAELLEDHLDEEGEEYLDKVLDAGRDAVKITKTARDVTKVLLSSGTDRTAVTLETVLEEQVEEVRSNHSQAIVTVEETISGIEVLADDMLGSLFRNLLTNAIVHNDKDLSEVAVSTTAEDDTVRVRIADNGPGIPDKQKERIFEEGKQGLDSEGTGLGLYLVRTLVDRYGGEVWVEDNEPTGSVFIVELPRSE